MPPTTPTFALRLRNLALHALFQISPFGAPAIGLLLIQACHIPWEGAFNCAVPGPVVTYLLLCSFGPFLFGPLAFFWFAVSIISLAALIIHVLRFVWVAIPKRD